MSSKADQAPIDTAQPLSASQVRAYLLRHPNFLSQYPDLLETLTPPALRSGDGVLDMQRFMLQRLQGELERLQNSQGELIAASRSNMTTQAQVNAAVLALLEATSFEHLIHIVTADFAELLDVEVVTICVEKDSARKASISTANVYVLPIGEVDRLMGNGRDLLLRQSSAAMEPVFGPAASLVRSDALVRLRFNAAAPVGLLALGARQTDKFHPGQGTELLQFLARALEQCVRAWLNLA